jgi:hypothetical protein
MHPRATRSRVRPSDLVRPFRSARSCSRALALSVLAALTLGAAPGLAGPFDRYPFDPEGDQLRAKFIVVGFPDSSLCDEPDNVAGTDMIAGIHVSIVETIRSYLDSHSGGLLTLTEDSGLLFRHAEREGFGESPDSLDTRQAWNAEYSACRYAEPSFGPEYPYLQDTSTWWRPGESCSELYSEILYKIYWEYWDQWEGHEDQAENQINPFPADGGPPWHLFFVFMVEAEGSSDAPGVNIWPPGP